MEVKNSSGYFKDPKTFEDFTVDTPRMVKCNLSDDNKFTWPMVATSDGDLVKIVYRLFTDEEKLLYKKYRGYDTSKPLKHRSVPTVAKQSPVSIAKDTAAAYEVEDMSYTAICYGTEQLITKCEKYIGTQFCSGISYALLTVRNSNTVYLVPRALISEADLLRLSNS